MKAALLIYLSTATLLMTSLPAHAHENPTQKGQCFVVSQKNQIQKCTINTGGGAGGAYTALKFADHQEYMIQESYMCEDMVACSFSLGHTVEDMTEAKSYDRRFTNQKITEKYYKNNWQCFQQIEGKIDVCYIETP